MENKQTYLITDAIEKQTESVEKFKQILKEFEVEVEKSLLEIEFAHRALLEAIRAQI